MKASELMVGDWVYVNNIATKVMQVNEDCEIWTHEDPFLPNENVGPINLTKEILEDNGWDVSDSCYAWYKIDEHIMLCYYWYENRLTKVLNIVDEWQNHSKVSDITFRARCLASVHELQHALRLCGFNDMADNFEIE